MVEVNLDITLKYLILIVLHMDLDMHLDMAVLIDK